MGGCLYKYLLLVYGRVQIGAHHETLTWVLSDLKLSALCNYFNTHNVNGLLENFINTLVVSMSLGSGGVLIVAVATINRRNCQY